MRTRVFFYLVGSLCSLMSLAACAPAKAGVPAVSPPPPSASPPASLADLGCTTFTVQPTAYIASGLPTISSSDYTRGASNAPVNMIVYCDFQTSQCQNFGKEVDQLLKNHAHDLRVVFRPVPAIGITDKAQLSAQAALAAGDQGKFWEMRDLLDAQYPEWVNLSTAQFDVWIKQQAAAVELDAGRFAADYSSSATAARAQSLHDSAMQLGLTNIPAVFINNNLQPVNLLDYRSVNDVVSIIALGTRQFSSCPAFTIDLSRAYVARVHTAKGDILIQLRPDKAPRTVNSFVFLATHGWFDGITFHRVLPGFVAQTGDPSGTGQGNPGYFFPNEISDLRFDKPGVVGMANSGPDTNGSQFFITYAPQPSLDGSYTIFGQVIQGMAVLESLTPHDPSQAADLPPGDNLLSVSIEEK